MDPAEVGAMHVGCFRVGVHNDLWDQMKTVLMHRGTDYNVTRRRLTLGVMNDTTGWYEKNWSETTIEMIIIPKNAYSQAVAAGVVVKNDAAGLTADVVVEGDEIYVNNTYYKVNTVQFDYDGDNFIKRTADLTRLSLHE